MNSELQARIAILTALNTAAPFGLSREVLLQDVSIRRKDIPRDVYPRAIDVLLANGFITVRRHDLDKAQFIYAIADAGIRSLEAEGLA